MINYKKISQFLFILFLLLLFLRIDFRFNSSINCCSDEYDYFLHASTIAFDFDFDYSNQNPREFRYYENGKNTPIGFVGSGILSAPFLLVGKIISNIFQEDSNKIILNYQILIYSLASVFYFCISYLLIFKTLNNLKIKFNKHILMLIFSGSGLTYFAFERYGLTHVFEVFTISMIIYSTVNFYLNKNINVSSVSISIFLMLSFLTRMSNIYIFLIPLIFKHIVLDRGFSFGNKLIKNKYFLLSSILSALGFALISIELYGEIVINPQKIYGTNIDLVETYVSINLSETFVNFAKTILNTMFTKEFGIFWVSPILFVGLLSPFLRLKNLKKLNFYLIGFCFAQNLFIIHIWQALGSSYGFRYLFSLTPLSIFVYYTYLKQNNFIKYYLFLFSIFSNLSILFFETTEATQLSTVNGLNSFGTSIRYIAPNYVIGLLSSFFELDSYLIIFTTSFLGAMFFKTILVLIEKVTLINFLDQLNLPVNNKDFLEYIDILSNISLDKFVFVVLLFYYVTYFYVFRLKN